MEDIFSVKNVPWVSEEPINLKDYFEKYSEALVTNVLHIDKLNTKEDIRKCFPLPQPDAKEDPFNIEKMEAACNPDLLTVKGELQSENISKFPVKQTGCASNWYIGKYQDKVIPRGSTEILHTLAALAKEHHMRDTVQDYATLRHKQLKYFNVVRLQVTDDQDFAEPRVNVNNQDDIVINVRVHKPFHHKMYHNKVTNAFPKHDVEMLFLGSQKLTDLCDNITCSNDLSICEDLSASPEFRHIAKIPNAAAEFPSSFMYINRVFYNDMRHPAAKDYSKGIKEWAQKRKEIGPMTTKSMEDTYLRDLELHLGYPYVYVHLGNCEHLLVFTDARLLHQRDVQDPSCYPILWGQPNKLACKCVICSLHLANWIVKGDPRLPQEYSHLCNRCLKTFCYNSYGKIDHTLIVYPFFGDFMHKQKRYTDGNHYKTVSQ